ncbi:uncharacterized protein, partial [Diadema antillarum]|uniref:uncharacterized protein n=1 Tax=Diadema antillarum TaxID=105358 RepID=UPI003A88A642
MQSQAPAGWGTGFSMQAGNQTGQSVGSSLLPPGTDQRQKKEGWDQDVSLDDVGFPGQSGRQAAGGGGGSGGGGQWMGGGGADWSASNTFTPTSQNDAGSSQGFGTYGASSRGQGWSRGRQQGGGRGGNRQGGRGGNRESGTRGFGDQDASEDWFAEMANAWNRGTDRGNRGAGRGNRGAGRGNRGAGRGQNAFQGRGSRGRGGMQRQPQNSWQTKNTGEWGTGNSRGAGRFAEMERKQGGASAGAQGEGMSDGSQVYMCELCDVPTTGLQNLEMHKKGQKHRANVARQEKGEEIHKGSRNKSSGKKRKIASDGSEIQEIQPVIDSCLEPLV